MADMTDDERQTRTLKIIADLHDLADDVLHSGGLQPEFDAGMLNAAEAILLANLDTDSAGVKAEFERQLNQRLARVLRELHDDDRHG